MPIINLIPWKELFLKLYNKLAINKDGKHRDRPVIVLLSILVAMAIYWPIVERIDPSKNVYRHLGRSAAGVSYSFYTGTTGGEYNRIGEELTARKSPITFQHVPRNATSGDQDQEHRRAGNMTMVLNETNAIAIVQQDELERAGIQDEVRTVTPLYGEKMHILYRLEDRDLLSAGTNVLPVLSRECPEALRSFLGKARIHMASGDSRKGSYLSDLVFLMCQVDVKQPRYGTAIGDAIEDLVGSSWGDESPNGIDVACIIAGSPLADLSSHLEIGGKLGLISIDPGTVSELNQTFGTRYQPTTFNGKYDSRFDRVRTLEVPAILVTSLDVPEPVILETSRLLDEIKEEGFPIHEYSSHDRVKRELPGPTRARAEAWGSFAAGVGLLSLFLMLVFTWAVSSVKLAHYSNQMTTAYKRDFPSNDAVAISGSGLMVPETAGDHQEVLNKLVEGMVELLKSIARIREDYDSGGITVTHQQHLMQTVYGLKAIFMRNISQHLCAAIESGMDLDSEELGRFFAAGYIDLPAYEYLSAQLPPSVELHSPPAPDPEDPPAAAAVPARPVTQPT